VRNALKEKRSVDGEIEGEREIDREDRERWRGIERWREMERDGEMEI
jgi:hypothetical protein